ncbi:hypothetical protein JCM16418_4036 [Paenibacillus pini JCM 16418]|uniref:Dynamin N-terminal domain-containing protein n=2 Tax=Paenibacillus TaxID=44249 RepID=W7YZ00_9BACL|nr:hypothetical protein JCM16418_4036 [Paenibacillus pini JCM 16418]
MALFGAFSAGKSSFANALLGEDVLPVSPHPTTAAINRILAPQDDFKHGTAQVKLKTLEALQDDLNYSFSVLHLGKATIDGWRQIASSLSPEGIHPAGLPHFGFLKAAALGWDQIQAQLGTTITADLQQYHSFVADESRSCFVESIDLYYSCPLTEQGIVLVDTPGADSLHARHTGVTFQYMKHADAIVFVTYYNHAFSKGDRQFLTQLGRVKDSFALDKMFFIVNASDLASSEDELQQVVTHVDQNLRARGIRLPHIYPLSSMNALEAKTSGDEALYQSSGFASFEKALGEFAGEELPRLSLQAAIQDVAAARKRAQEWSAMAKQDEGARQKRIQQLLETKEIAAERIKTFGTVDLSRDMVQEIQELLFHVRQRIGFNLGEFFLEAFHPSVLREDAGQLKQVFVDCGRELERTLVRELDQELWATTLRLENKGKALVHTAAAATVQDIHDRDAVLLLTIPEEKSWPSPDWGDLQMDAFIDWSSMASSFKSPKNFFEGGGRDKLRQTVDPLIKEVLGVASEEKQQQLIDFYCSQAAGAQERQASIMQEQLKDMLQSMLQMLESPDDTESWDLLANQLMSIEQSIH